MNNALQLSDAQWLHQARNFCGPLDLRPIHERVPGVPAPMKGKDPTRDLTPAECKALTKLHDRWRVARKEKRWADADRYRAELVESGCIGANLDAWHPNFENGERRKARLAARQAAIATPTTPPP